MFEEEAKEYCTQQEFSKDVRDNIYNAFKDGAEFGFQKGIKAKLNITTISDCHIIWHKVADEDLPTEDLRVRTLGYYLTASKQKYYKGFVFEVAYFTGVVFIKDGDILDNVVAWCEIPEPEL